MKEGKEDLVQFITNRGSKVVDEALQVGWEMEEAEENWKGHERLPCIANCDGEWLEVVEDTLTSNNLTGGSF